MKNGIPNDEKRAIGDRRKKAGIALLFVAAIVLVALSVTLSLGYRERTWVVYFLNPYYWPIEYSYVLWGIALWILTDILKHFKYFRYIGFLAKPFILALMIYGGLSAFDLLSLESRRYFYLKYYMPYVLAPVSEFFSTGKWNWNLLVIPTFVFAVITVLLVINRHIKKKNEPSQRIET